MNPAKQPVSKLKMALLWVIFLGASLFWIGFLVWRRRGEPAPVDDAPAIVHLIVMVFVGGFFFILGVGSYFILLATNCFTFNFSRPVWSGMKGKLYFANVVVLTGSGLGMGFALSPFVTPLLTAAGISSQIAFMVPVMAVVVLLQIVRIFVLIWAPMERRLIIKRLQARGITPAQLQSAALIGISNPLRSSFKKLSQVEEDIGALWVGPDQMVYWGDSQEFAVTRQQLAQLERKADTGGTTMLGGFTHIILHVQQPDGTERQIRLHTEGHWTMGAKGRAMDALENAILQWHGPTAETTASF